MIINIIIGSTMWQQHSRLSDLIRHKKEYCIAKTILDIDTLKGLENGVIQYKPDAVAIMLHIRSAKLTQDDWNLFFAATRSHTRKYYIIAYGLEDVPLNLQKLAASIEILVQNK